MEETTIPGTLYSILSISTALVLMFMSRPAGSSTMPTISGETAKSGLSKISQFFGVFVPYILMVVPVLVDMGAKKFKYSIVTIVGLLSMAFGFGIQRAISGGVGQLTMLTIATSAMVGFLFQDIIVQPVNGTTRGFSCFFMIVALILQVLNSAYGTLFSTPLMNDLAAVSLGTGLGVTGWLIVWSSSKTHLPYFVETQPTK